MRGEEKKQGSMLFLMLPEQLVPAEHPIRRIKVLADDALRELSPTFDAMYSETGRPSTPPEQLLKATLLMALYSVRSERQLCEQLGYNMLFRWFLDMDMSAGTFDVTVFTKNRERLLEHDVAGQFFRQVVEQARSADLMSSEHFTVDGTLIEAAASLKSFRPKAARGRKPPPDDPGNPSVDFHGEKRSNETHASTTDPEAKLARKSGGTTAKLSFAAHSLMENRHGLLVDFRVTEANGKAERATALSMIEERLTGSRRITVGADKGYDTFDFVDDCRSMHVTPHIASHTTRSGGSGIDRRTTRHASYSISQRVRKRVEEIFGWMKTIGGFRRTRYRGIARTQLAGYMVAAAYNLLRMARLTPNTA